MSGRTFDPFTHFLPCPWPLATGEETVTSLLDVSGLPSLDIDHSHERTGFPLSPLLPSSVDLAELRQRSVPPPKIVAATFHCAIVDSQAPVASFWDTRFEPALHTPLWILRYWMRIRSVMDGQRAWEDRRQWLLDLLMRYAQSNGAEYDEVAIALASLRVIPWSDQVHDNPVIHSRDLLEILGDQPLSESVVSILVHVTRRDMRAARPATNSGIVVHNLPLAALLRGLSFDTANYEQELAAPVALARHLAAGLAGGGTGVRCAYIPWHSHGAYRLFALESQGRVIRHGCMGDTTPPPDDLALLQAWLAWANVGGWSIGESLPFGGPDDHLSSGIAMINTLRHILLGEETWHPGDSGLHRVREFMRVLIYVCD